MSKGLLYDAEYCTGCFACTVACKQEHGFDADTWGMRVIEQIYTIPENRVAGLPKVCAVQDSTVLGGKTPKNRVQVDNILFPTKLCDLCAERLASGEDDKPACVKACQGGIIYYGEVEDLVKLLPTLKRPVLWARP